MRHAQIHSVPKSGRPNKSNNANKETTKYSPYLSEISPPSSIFEATSKWRKANRPLLSKASKREIDRIIQRPAYRNSTMSLYAFISNIWTAFASSPPPKKRGRRPQPFSPDTIEPINHWYPGDRNRHQSRRLDDTPNSAHYPKFRIAKSVVSRGRKRCPECGALVKEEGGNAAAPPRTVRTVRTARRKSTMSKAAERRKMEREMQKQIERELKTGIVRRALKGRVVEYDQ
jgi:hypothetical protein